MSSNWIVEDNIAVAHNYRNKAMLDKQKVKNSDRDIRKEVKALMKKENISELEASEKVKRAYRTKYLKDLKASEGTWN